jgi:hypothetical protein
VTKVPDVDQIRILYPAGSLRVTANTDLETSQSRQHFYRPIWLPTQIPRMADP